MKYVTYHKRSATKGRINSMGMETVYAVHEKGALPRDVIKIPALSGPGGKRERIPDNPTQKPVELAKRLLNSCRQTDGTVNNILIPFAGTGTEIVACHLLENCRFLAFELSPKFAELARQRVARD